VSGGELFTHLYQREKFKENEVRIYIAEIVVALQHLHKVRNAFFFLSSLFLGLSYVEGHVQHCGTRIGIKK
jgi:serine/threonine protein kinase